MHFYSHLSTLAIFSAISLVSGFASSSTYDNTYDNGTNSLAIVACSNGENGLLTKGFTTFDSLPDFPYIGGAPAVAGWNSPNCGTCWALTYKGKTIYITAIDATRNGNFNIAQEALDDLTDNQAVQLGIVDITAKQVDVSYCGF